MPVTCSCPTCQKPLRVPDELIGRLVRCPGCQGTFPATAAAPTPPAPPSPPTPQQIQPNPSPTNDLPKLLFDDAPHSPPGIFPPPIGDQSTAQSLVKGPSLALMIVSGVLAGLSVLIFLGATVFYVFVLSAAGSASTVNSTSTTVPAKPGAPNVAAMGIVIVVNFAELLLTLAWAVVIFLGARRMSQLRSYPFAMTAAITAMVPLGGCVCGLFTVLPWLVSVGFGIWALIVLCKPEVKSAFQ